MRETEGVFSKLINSTNQTNNDTINWRGYNMTHVERFLCDNDNLAFVHYSGISNDNKY